MASSLSYLYSSSLLYDKLKLTLKLPELSYINSIIGNSKIDNNYELKSELINYCDILYDYRKTIISKVSKFSIPFDPIKENLKLQIINLLSNLNNRTIINSTESEKSSTINYVISTISTPTRPTTARPLSSSRPSTSISNNSSSSINKPLERLQSSAGRIIESERSLSVNSNISNTSVEINSLNDLTPENVALLKQALELEKEELLSEIEYIQNCIQDDMDEDASRTGPSVEQLKETNEYLQDLKNENLLKSNNHDITKDRAKKEKGSKHRQRIMEAKLFGLE